MRKPLFPKNQLKEATTKGDLVDIHSSIYDQNEINKQGLENTMEKNQEQILTHLDGIAKSIDTLSTEKAIAREQLDRHEKWIKTIAEKVGVELPRVV